MTSIPPAPDSSRDTLMEALEVAHHPKGLSEERHEAILARVLGIAPAVAELDPLAPASEAERLEAERLALALEGVGQHELAELALALTAAHRPSEVSELGLARAVKPTTLTANGGGRSTKSRRWFMTRAGSAAAVIALAAAIALTLRTRQQTATPTVLQQPEFAISRSLAPLFVDQSTQGTTTERMDRIVMARSRDLRHNRYLSWRVR